MPNVNPLFDERDYALGYQQRLEHVLAALRYYPDKRYGDEEVLKEVDRIVKECSSDNLNIRSLRQGMFNKGWRACLAAMRNEQMQSVYLACEQPPLEVKGEPPMSVDKDYTAIKRPICERGKPANGPCGYAHYCSVCGRKCTGEFKVSGSYPPKPICSLCKADAAKGETPVQSSKFTFTHETLLTFMEGIMAMALEQSRQKNADYASVAGSTNTGLANFYETAKRYGGSPLHALAVHRLKHELSIEKMLRGEELKSEPIMGRIIDAINYNILALALYIETRQDVELLNKAADEMAAVGVTLGVTDRKYKE